MVQASVIPPPRRLADWVDAYESALAENADCDFARFLPPRNDDAYLRVLVELVRIDLERGWRAGARPPMDAFLSRFPEIAASPEALAAVAFEEYRQRLLCGEPLARDEYAARYGVDVSQWPADHAARDADPSGSLPDCAASACPASACSVSAASDVELSSVSNSAAGEVAWPCVGENFGGFALLAELGRGAFARVFLARQPELANRQVVLKVSDRFPGESQAIAQLQHTNIVPIYSQHRLGRFHALCMPYFGKATLADVLQSAKAAGQWPTSGEALASTIAGCTAPTQASTATSTVEQIAEQETDSRSPVNSLLNWRLLDRFTYVDAVLWLFSRLAAGLEHAHERSVLHRDIKPANILLRDDGEPMLLDFNLSGRQAADAPSLAAVLGGTLPYMSPEQIRALRGESVAVGAQADVFSLGVVLYEMLTGDRPFPDSAGSSRAAFDRAIAAIAAGHSLAAAAKSGVSPAVQAIVAKCLANDPAERYATAGELAEDLRRQIEHLPLRHAADTSWRERWRKWRRRHPRATSATAVACVAAAAIAVVSALLWSAEQSIARNRAQESFESFLDDSLDAQFLLAAADPSSPERRMGRELALRTLSTYSADTNATPERALDGDAALLDSADLERLHEELDDLRAALATDESRTAPPQDNAPSRRENGESNTPGNSPQAVYRQARSEYAAGRFAAAVELLAAAVERQPKQVRYWMLRGRAEEAQMHHAEAVTCYTACIVLKPDWAPAYVYRGVARFHLQQHRAAIADFDRALALDDDSTAEVVVHALVNRALAHQQLGNFDAAITDLDRAIALQPDRTRFYHLRARMHRRAGRADLAARDERTALARDPQDAEGWIARGVFLLPARPEQALAAFQAAVEQNPRSLEGLRNSAHVLAEYLRQPDHAIESLSQAIALYPDCAPALLGRGVLHARAGNRDAALADARLGLKLDSGAASHYQAACIFAQTSRAEKSDADEAINLLFAALHLGFDRDMARRDPDLAPIRAHRDFARLVAAPSAASVGNARSP